MVFTYPMLYEAWKKNIHNYEEPNRAKFNNYLEDNLYFLLDELNSGEFRPSGMRIKVIQHPKKRIVQVPAIRDKIVQHAICDNYLYDVVTRPLIKETSACLIGRGDAYASKLMIEHMVKYRNKHGTDFYVLKADIHHYFQSISHDRLKKLIYENVEDVDVLRILFRFIDMTDTGIPLGLQQSQLLANLFLSEMDHRIKENLCAELYIRHMDDFCIISKSVNYLEICRSYIERYVNSIGLTLNPKTGIFHNEISFLGFNYKYVGETGKINKRLDKGKRNSKRSHIKKLLRELKNGTITAEKFATSYSGWRAHALQGDCHSLVAAWDSWLSGELKKMGYEIFFQKRSVRVYVKDNLST